MGGILLVVVAISLAQALGYAKSKVVQYLWPTLILMAGLFLPLYLLLLNGIDKVGDSARLIISDTQQREHILMASLLVVAGVVETLRRANILKSEQWRFVWPVVLVLLGITFAVHTQKGTPEAVAWAIRRHFYLGSIIILAGLFKVADVLWGRKFKWLAFPWILLLLVAAVLFITYREPEGAFRTEPLSVQQTEA